MIYPNLGKVSTPVINLITNKLRSPLTEWNLKPATMLRFKRYASRYNQAKILRKYPVGAVFHGYEIKRILPVQELKLTAVDLIHLQTGSQHLHIDRDDKNNAFSVAFKTNPPNATGVPHILEHMTLCGSHKYPVRDPFFKMLNRSLANFMNAMTGHDYTFYPFATTNKADFENLRDVYLDATFNPLLKPEDFYQEGWRLEHEKTDDPKSPITFKGVVYNEMKGQVSNANYYFWIKFQESIYPSLNNSGGDPKKITNLQYPDLVSFHELNYHPSNAKTFTYGNFPLQETLARLDEEFKGFGKRVLSKDILKPLEFKHDIEIKSKGQVDPMLPPDKQLKTSMTWLCGEPENTYETFLLKVLGNLLMDGHSSPFYQKLIESGIGYEFSVNSGVESTTATNFFTIGVQGCSDTAQFESTVREIFHECLEKPFEGKKIEAIVQQLELSKKDQKSDFGLHLLYSLLPGWVNKTDPFDGMLFDEILEQFREDFETKGDAIFHNIINKYILDKPCFKFTMEASETFSQDLDLEESQRLKDKIEAMDETDKEVIYKRGLHLQEKQNAEEDLSLLPSLHISDIPRTADVYPVTSKESVMNRITDTNGITYLRAKKSLNQSIPRELYPYLSLFAESLTSLGTSTEDYADIENEMKLHTGGVSTSVNVHQNPVTSVPELQFQFDGWCLNSKTEFVFDIWRKLLTDTDFNKHKEKLRVLIRSLASSNTAAVAESGHSFARNFTAAHFNNTKAIFESLAGMEQLQLVTRLSNILDDDSLFQTEVVDKLRELQGYVIGSQGLGFFVTTDSSNQVQAVEKQIDEFVRALPSEATAQNFCATNYPLLNSNGLPTLIDFPFQVHYAAESMKGVSYTHQDGASLQVLANMLTFKYLHREIREKGGAYGAGANYSALDGIFNFYSYRDPHALKSLETFAKSGEYVLNDAKWTAQDLDEAKLTIFQQIDAPISCKGEGSILFYYGITDQMRQQRRQSLLDVQLLDIHRAAEKYLVGKPSVSAVLGPYLDAEMPRDQWNIEKL